MYVLVLPTVLRGMMSCVPGAPRGFNVCNPGLSTTYRYAVNCLSRGRSLLWVLPFTTMYSDLLNLALFGT